MSNTLEKAINPIKRHTIADGYLEVLIDLEKSEGPYIYNKFNDKNYLDFMSFYASMPLGFNHPSMLNDIEFLKKLQLAALNKIANSDFYTDELSNFIDTFATIGVPKQYSKFFFISGGAAAVENSLKAAFDWKVQKNLQLNNKPNGKQIIHFNEAFHGRHGYTLSITSGKVKSNYFPTFSWPRINNPKIIFPLQKHISHVEEQEEISIEQIMNSINQYGDDIAGLIIEPIQGEGGDNHFRHEFLSKLRKICDENEIMLIYDEVQTGVALTGKMWALEHFPNAEPDIVAFGKKTQVCGIFSNKRIDEVSENVFKKSSRINSTWGGSIVDMVRFEKIIRIIHEDQLIENCDKMGSYLFKIMSELEEKYDTITNSRHRGLFAAFDISTQKLRDQIKSSLIKNGLFLLGSGEKSIRFRPSLNINETHIDEMFHIFDYTLSNL